MHFEKVTLVAGVEIDWVLGILVQMQTNQLEGVQSDAAMKWEELS